MAVHARIVVECMCGTGTANLEQMNALVAVRG